MRVFIVSPGDVSEERDIASYIVSEVNRMFGNPLDIQLESIRWETHTWPDVGEDAQDVINKQIGEFDILVGVMWKHFGTPTKRAKSGTGEEFERAYQLFKKYGRPRIMFYFRKTPFYPKDINEISQFRKVTQFRKKLEKLGVLYGTYQTPIEFERYLREHLIREILKIINVENKIMPLLKIEKYGIGKTPLAPQRLPERFKECLIFMGYSHEDREAVMTVYHSIKGAGYRSWLDVEDLVPGEMWFTEVDKAIRKADIKLMFFSSQPKSKEGSVSKELKIAIDNSIMSDKESFLILVRLDNVELPVELRHFHCIDYFLPDGLDRLLDAIEHACETSQKRSETKNNQ